MDKEIIQNIIVVFVFITLINNAILLYIIHRLLTIKVINNITTNSVFDLDKMLKNEENNEHDSKK